MTVSTPDHLMPSASPSVLILNRKLRRIEHGVQHSRSRTSASTGGDTGAGGGVGTRVCCCSAGLSFPGRKTRKPEIVRMARMSITTTHTAPFPFEMFAMISLPPRQDVGDDSGGCSVQRPILPVDGLCGLPDGELNLLHCLLTGKTRAPIPLRGHEEIDHIGRELNLHLLPPPLVLLALFKHEILRYFRIREDFRHDDLPDSDPPVLLTCLAQGVLPLFAQLFVHAEHILLLFLSDALAENLLPGAFEPSVEVFRLDTEVRVRVGDVINH